MLVGQRAIIELQDAFADSPPFRLRAVVLRLDLFCRLAGPGPPSCTELQTQVDLRLARFGDVLLGLQTQLVCVRVVDVIDELHKPAGQMDRHIWCRRGIALYLLALVSTLYSLGRRPSR
eukprot:6670385-Prymnesium_polylepis.1